MATRDHMMGYAPAANDWFMQFEYWDLINGDYPLGMPKRVLDEFERRRKAHGGSMRERALKTPILRIDHRYSTKADLTGISHKRYRAIAAARPMADLLDLHIEVVEDERPARGVDTLVRNVRHVEPEPPVCGGYPVDADISSPLARSIAMAQVEERKLGSELRQDIARAAQQLANVNAVQAYNDAAMGQQAQGMISDYHRGHPCRQEQNKFAALNAALAQDPFATQRFLGALTRPIGA